MRTALLSALGLTLALVATSASAGATLDRVKAKGELVNVLMESYPPFSQLNAQNQLEGFDVDVAKAVADKLGVKLRLETPSWDVIAAGRWSGRYDVCICSMTPSQARAQVFDFPVNYYASPAVIVVNAGDDRIHGLSLIHADGTLGVKRVVEHGLDDRYLSLIVAIFRRPV